jgi:hypothetical protein
MLSDLVSLVQALNGIYIGGEDNLEKVRRKMLLLAFRAIEAEVKLHLPQRELGNET